MASIPKLYGDNVAVSECYSCPKNGTGNIDVAGKQMRLECRQFTKFGMMIETMQSATQTARTLNTQKHSRR